MKKFFSVLLSDSNKYSTKRFIGILCLVMFIAYGIVGLIKPFNINFWIFYVSLCNITMWIAFRFMSAEKILKYDVITKLTKFGNVQQAVQEFQQTETTVDSQIQPDTNSTETPPVEQLPENSGQQ
jgi:hypothetical protein